MATRGIKVLIILPLLFAPLIVACRLATELGLGQFVLARPDQQVVHFLSDVNTGQVQAARHFLDPATVSLDPAVLHRFLRQRYGPAVVYEVELRHWSPDRAVVWSQTRTAAGNGYFLTWTLAPRQGRWVITDIPTLRAVLDESQG